MTTTMAGYLLAPGPFSLSTLLLSVCLSVCLSRTGSDYNHGRLVYWLQGRSVCPHCYCLSVCLSVCLGLVVTTTMAGYVLATGPFSLSTLLLSVCLSVCL